MFKYSDNPALFVAIYKQYGKRFRKNFQSLDNDCFFTDEELARIENLEIDFEGELAEIPFKNLNGIEKLVNLRKFSYYGKDYDSMRLDIVALDHKRNHNFATDFLLSKLIFQELVENSQQIDFSGLKNCKNLEVLKIYNAHSLTTLDVTPMPKLTNIQVNTCPNLTNIIGLENLNAIKNAGNSTSILDRFSIFNFNLNFDNCPAISNIVNFDKLVEVWQNNYKLFRTLDLATTCFPRLERKYPEAMRKLEEKDFVNWNDYVDSGSKYTITTKQARLAKERCDEIIRTICRDEDSPIKRVAKIYRWICENVTYDRFELDHPNEVTQEIEERTRSLYRALFDKKAVCVGISNLFNFFCADIGYLAVPCYCGTVKFDSSVVYGDHQISKMIINGNSYYFDPTWDLGNKTLKYFGLNRDEISANHGLTIDDDNTPNAPSIQKELAQKNYLTEELFDEIPDWLKNAIIKRDDQIIHF